MLEIGASEAEGILASLLDRVQNGEEILITRHGKPVAHLVPDHHSPRCEEIEAAMSRIRARAAAWPSEPFDWASVKRDRDAGRP